MMKIKNFFYIIPIIFVSIGCSTYKANNNDMLVSSIDSKKFEATFKLCNNKNDTIFIYNNLIDFKDSLSLKNSCDRTIIILKSNIKIDVNSSIPIKDNKIVLYKYDIIGNKYELSFIEIGTNANLTLVFNNRNKLIASRSGNF